MAVYQENPDGTISTVVEDTTIGQIEDRIKDSLCIESTCGADILAAVSVKPIAVVTIAETISTSEEV